MKRTLKQAQEECQREIDLLLDVLDEQKRVANQYRMLELAKSRMSTLNSLAGFPHLFDDHKPIAGAMHLMGKNGKYRVMAQTNKTTGFDDKDFLPVHWFSKWTTLELAIELIDIRINCLSQMKSLKERINQ